MKITIYKQILDENTKYIYNEKDNNGKVKWEKENDYKPLKC